jgi:hypothetical protein
VSWNVPKKDAGANLARISAKFLLGMADGTLDAVRVAGAGGTEDLQKRDLSPIAGPVQRA